MSEAQVGALALAFLGDSWDAEAKTHRLDIREALRLARLAQRTLETT